MMTCPSFWHLEPPFSCLQTPSSPSYFQSVIQTLHWGQEGKMRTDPTLCSRSPLIPHPDTRSLSTQTCQEFCRRSSNREWSGIFLVEKLRLWVLAEDHRGEMPFSSCHIKCTYYPHVLSLLMLTLITWLGQCWPDFFTMKLLFFSFFQYCLLWKTISLYSLHFRSGVSCCTCLWVEYLHK